MPREKTLKSNVLVVVRFVENCGEVEDFEGKLWGNSFFFSIFKYLSVLHP